MNQKDDSSIEKKVYDIIRKAILQRKLTPGMKISALSLSQEIGVSRTPVRLALQQLTAEGFVVMKSNKAAHVAKPSVRNIKELFFLREVLESTAVALACQNVKKRDIKKLREINDLEGRSFKARDLSRYNEANEAFHLQIAKMAGNDLLYETIEKLVTQSTIILSLFDPFYDFSKEDEANYKKENELLISLIENRAEKKASEEIKQHIQRSLGNLSLDKLDELTSMIPRL